MPDKGHIVFTLPKDIKWEKHGDDYDEAVVFGDPNKYGVYGQAIRWNPGHNSTPHFHTTDRYIYVVSGTWWVSSSTRIPSGLRTRAGASRRRRARPR